MWLLVNGKAGAKAFPPAYSSHQWTGGEMDFPGNAAPGISCIRTTREIWKNHDMWILPVAILIQLRITPGQATFEGLPGDPEVQ